MVSVEIPPIIRSLFDKFPLETISDVPSKDSKPASPGLYVHRLENGVSIDPSCHQVILLVKLMGEKVEIKESSALANNNGRLPLLVETAAHGEKSVYTTPQAIINRWSGRPWFTAEVQVYKTFIDSSLGDLWVLLAVSSEEDAGVIESVYFTESDRELPQIVQTFIAKEVKNTLISEMGARYPAAVKEFESIYSEASLPKLQQSRQDIYDRATECVETLQQLISEKGSGFVSIGPSIQSSKPVGFLDILVYTYVNAISKLQHEASSIVSPLKSHRDLVARSIE